MQVIHIWNPISAVVEAYSFFFFIKKAMYLKEVLQKQTAIFLVLIIYAIIIFTVTIVHNYKQ